MFLRDFVVKDRWFVVPGSGTGDLQGLRSRGEFEISGQGPFPISFEYAFK
ncbi:MAG: DUF3224 domain-containing protein [Chloroflexi bacterium]|nr:DUF3224 domain-containing protein [Chloroflexota bacterium]